MKYNTKVIEEKDVIVDVDPLWILRQILVDHYDSLLTRENLEHIEPLKRPDAQNCFISNDGVLSYSFDVGSGHYEMTYEGELPNVEVDLELVNSISYIRKYLRNKE